MRVSARCDSPDLVVVQTGLRGGPMEDYHDVVLEGFLSTYQHMTGTTTALIVTRLGSIYIEFDWGKRTPSEGRTDGAACG